MQSEFIYAPENAPTPECHASTLCLLPDGTLCASWFGGTREGNADVNIWFSRRKNGNWEVPRIVASAPGPHWNPVLFYRDGVIRLYYKRGELCNAWRTYYTHSEDNGDSFAPFEELVPGDNFPRGPVKNKPIYLNGTILAPSSMEFPVWYAYIDRSADNGKTWTRSNDIFASPEEKAFTERFNGGARTPPDAFLPGIIQPTLWATSDRDVYALFRSNCGWILRSESHDGGVTFSQAEQTEMPNNNSGIDAVCLKDGRIVLVCNPFSLHKDRARDRFRSPLSVMLSTDNGLHFKKLMDLENDPGEFSYPSVINAPDGGIHIVYTWCRKSIKHTYLSLEDLGA